MADPNKNVDMRVPSLETCKTGNAFSNHVFCKIIEYKMFCLEYTYATRNLIFYYYFSEETLVAVLLHIVVLFFKNILYLFIADDRREAMQEEVI